MSTSSKPATLPPTTGKGGQKSASLDEAGATVKRQFVNLALTMMWQLAVVFLVPVVVGAQIDKAQDNGSRYVYVGLALATVGSVLVMWRAMKVANQMPVPKLNDE